MQVDVSGILLLDKPQGITSNATLQRAKKIFNAKKAGHAGSLDPIATGMLPIFFGEATKFSQFLLNADKHYYVTAKCGEKTTTGDREGAVLEQRAVPKLDITLLQETLNLFRGEIAQVPPMYSAIKFQGQPLYQLARRGIEIPRNARNVHIYSIQIEQCAEDTFTFNVHCSKGTYVRTLVEDIGEKLGCGAHVLELRRTMVAPYQQAISYTLDELAALAQSSQHTACLLTIDSALATLPKMQISVSSAFYLRNGQTICASVVNDANFVRIYSESGLFLGICEATGDGRIKPLRLLKNI